MLCGNIGGDVVPAAQDHGHDKWEIFVYSELISIIGFHLNPYLMVTKRKNCVVHCPSIKIRREVKICTIVEQKPINNQSDINIIIYVAIPSHMFDFQDHIYTLGSPCLCTYNTSFES